MPALKDAATSSEFSLVSETQALDATALASAPSRSRVDYEGWRTVINEPLIDWENDPEKLDDGIIEPPSREIVTLALKCGMVWRDQELPAPDNVVPNGDGGIAFNWYFGDDLATIEFGEDGTIELIVFEKSKISHRQRIP